MMRPARRGPTSDLSLPDEDFRVDCLLLLALVQCVMRASAALPSRSAVAAAPSRRPRPPRAPIRAVRADAAPPRDAVDASSELRRWCDRTRGGVFATPADVAEVHRLARALASASAASPSPAADLAGTSWRLLGCAQATLPAPASWLASPFFWIAKEAQHESYRLAVRVPDLFPPFKLAARISAGDPPKTGEEWIRAFGRREVSAAFPFSVLESVLNRLEVPFSSGNARVIFERADGRERERERERDHLRMISRVHVDFADGGLVGELVTACTLEPIDDAEEIETEPETFETDAFGKTDETFAWALRRRACLETTAFEGTGTPLDGVSVPSGAIMRALMSPSPRLRRMRGRGGAAQATTYRRAISGDGDAMVVLAGSCDETATVLVYAREYESSPACA